VLAMAGRRYYAVPLTYRGQFERRARKFAGSRQLLTDARPGSVVCVTYLDRGENLPLSTGDRLRVLAGHDDHKLLYVRCERYPTSVTAAQGGYIFYAGASLAGVSCRGVAEVGHAYYSCPDNASSPV